MVRDENLIYDLGLHRGEDAEFYLKKGFRVVAVDANPVLCRDVEARFAEAIAAGRLTVVNRAIAAAPGEVTFFENEESEWGTIDPEWAARNLRLGSASVERTVPAVTLASLIAEFGSPYYMKIDLEGADQIALAGLGEAKIRPKYVSVESDKVSFTALRREFELLESLGYDRFKVVCQGRVMEQRLPPVSREGAYAQHSFAFGSSGAFGEEAPGEWLTAAEAIEAYRPIFLRYALTGDDPFVRSRLLRKILRRLGFGASWYDTHARLADS